jgi:hypothetical protein
MSRLNQQYLRKSWLSRALPLWLSLAVACSAPETATELLVVIDAEPSLRTMLSTVTVLVYDEAGSEELSSATFALSRAKGAPPGKTFPLSYSLIPAADAAKRFRVVVTGLTPGEGEGPEVELVQSQHIASFVQRQRSLLTVMLWDRCARQLCSASDWGPSARSCTESGCATVEPIPPTEAGSGPLGGYVRPSAPDGGREPPIDAGPDSAPPADTSACVSALDCQELLGDLEPAGCAEAECVEQKCELRALDADGDRHGNKACSAGGKPLGDDCDDADPARFPGAWDGPAIEGEQADSCDAIDNDCDGQLDDGVAGQKTCVCDPAKDKDVACSLRPDGTVISWPAGTPVGDCRAGKRSCIEGRWSACVGAVEPAAKDSCEPVLGADADCDGKLNEDCPCTTGSVRPCAQPNVGSCKAGEQLCVSGVWSKECRGAITPQAEDTCEPGNDASCDGVANEGCACVNGQTKTCGEALRAKGECAKKMVVCVDGKWPESSCVSAALETCADDGKDENCNGEVNEQPYCQCTNGRSALCGTLDRTLRGNCALGTRRCVNGAYTACDVTPSARDLCIYLDDSSCNGRINEGCECLLGDTQSCGPAGCNGQQSCALGGRWGACSYTCPAPEPPVEPAAI